MSRKPPTDELECPKCGGEMVWKYLTSPRCPKCNPVEITNRATGKPQSMRATRYVYHVCGHAKLHPWASDVINGAPEQGPVVPFEVVLRLPYAIDSDDTMEMVRQEVRDHIVAELKAQDSPFIVGDVMVRGVSKLHRILVEVHDPEGPAVRIMS